MNPNKIFVWVGTRKGALLTILLLVAVWILGYLALNTYAYNDWHRFILQRNFTRFTLVITLIIVLGSIIHSLRNPISFERNAYDLAIFRIIFLAIFAYWGTIKAGFLWDQTMTFVELPDSAISPLPFMKWYTDLVPFNKSTVSVFTVLFGVSAVCSLIGFKTRWSLILFTISAFYMLGIPNFYGKVNHYHHFIWFPFILAFSPCAEVLSVDAWLRKRKGITVSKSTSWKYTRSFYFIWALMGIIYFFPGFWKLWASGLDWMFTDNVRNQMYYKWLQIDHWRPFLRIDLVPALYKSSGLFVVLFELLFLPLLFNRATRKWAIIGGLLFHLGTWFFMNIFFVILVLSYVSFIPWHRLKWFRPQPPDEKTLTISKNRALNLMGCSLIAGLILFGFGKWNSWPLTVYPTFDSCINETYEQFSYYVVQKNGELKPLEKTVLTDKYQGERYWQMEQLIIQDFKEKKIANHEKTLADFCTDLISNNAIEGTIEIRLETRSILPDLHDQVIHFSTLYVSKK